MVGQFHFIELEMRRIPTITHHENKRQTHYTIQLTLPKEYDAKALADLRADSEKVYTREQYQLPAPVDENPFKDFFLSFIIIPHRWCMKDTNVEP